MEIADLLTKLDNLLATTHENEILEFKEAKNANGFDKLCISFGVKQWCAND